MSTNLNIAEMDAEADVADLESGSDSSPVGGHARKNVSNNLNSQLESEMNSGSSLVEPTSGLMTYYENFDQDLESGLTSGLTSRYANTWEAP